MEHGAFREEDRKGMMSMSLYDALLELQRDAVVAGRCRDSPECG